MTATTQFLRRALGFAVAISAAAFVSAGCRSMDASAKPAPRSGTAELIAYAAEQPYTTADTAYRATYALATGQSFDGEFEALREKLREDNLIGNWPYEANERVRKADVGYMVCKACKIQTGVNWNLTGLGRYAWRELIYHDIAKPSSEMGFITGGEFVGVLLKAEEYLQAEGETDAGPVELRKPGA